MDATIDPPNAPFLFPPKTMDELTEEERRGEFTLERLRERRPELIPEIVKLRGQWVSQLKIAKKLGVSVNTVAAVDKEYAEPIESIRQRQIALCEDAGYQLVAQISESPGLVPWAQKALSAKMLLEFAELKAGRATQRIETGERVDIEAVWNDFLAGLPSSSEKRLGPGEVRELEAPAIGLPGGNSLQLGDQTPADPVPAQVPAGTDPGETSRRPETEEN